LTFLTLRVVTTGTAFDFTPQTTPDGFAHSVRPRAAPNTLPGIGRQPVPRPATARDHSSVPETHPYPHAGALKTTGSRLATVPVLVALRGRAASRSRSMVFPFFPSKEVFCLLCSATVNRCVGRGPIQACGVRASDAGRPPGLARPTTTAGLERSPRRAPVRP